jgi:hypothetical protein
MPLTLASGLTLMNCHMAMQVFPSNGFRALSGRMTGKPEVIGSPGGFSTEKRVVLTGLAKTLGAIRAKSGERRREITCHGKGQ